MNKTHWTYRLFVENAELYLPFLEQAKERVPHEIEALTGLFSAYDVPENGKVLDVACGIGRHSVPLAMNGYQVLGIDFSPLFLEKAKESAATNGVSAQFVTGDVLEVESLLENEKPFDAFINMFTSHSYYGREGDISMFRQLRNLASPGAVLIVLTANRDWIIRNFKPEGLEKAEDIRILQRRSMDLESSIILNNWEFYEGERETLRLRLKLDMNHRIYSLHELKEVLEESGWQYLSGLGKQEGDDMGLGPLTIDSKVMWVVARA